MFADRPVAIVDIGSNSVRLVVYSGASRAPSIIFNEKVTAELGRGLAEGGALTEGSQERALVALGRFRALAEHMGVVRLRVVATAAVREATNGSAFIAKVRESGLEPEIVPGDEEGRLAGLGVLSGIPEADGIAADLGGGSLELVDLRGGQTGRAVSLPLGVLRVQALAARGEGALRDAVGETVARHRFKGAAAGRPLYLVGGSWRSLARLDMALSGHPLPIAHQHAMLPARPRELERELGQMSCEALRALAPVSASRARALPLANALLDALVDALDPILLIVSSYGIREGLLFDSLDARTRALDPLIEQAREAGAGLGRFEQHGTLLDSWIGSVFEDPPAAARIRHAACLLSDVAWAAHPDYRAERGVDLALHGNWVALDAPGRVLLAQALSSRLGNAAGFPPDALARLCTPAALARARQWGLAMALGQRLSGGVAAGLEHSALRRDATMLTLSLSADVAALSGKSVHARLKALAGEMALEPRLIVAEGEAPPRYA